MSQIITNAKFSFFVAAIISAFVSTLSGCSESTKEAKPLPDIISKVHHPYIKGNALFSFEPESGESEKLIESELGMFLALDTDKSNPVSNENGSETFENTSSAEYFIAANKQTLHLYDLNTRKEHLIFSFKDDLVVLAENNELTPAPESYICDIQKVITLDEDARLGKVILYKDELKVYVKTSYNSDCTSNNQAYTYWQIDIINSQEETYTIRRKTLLEHSHDHTHFHDHNDPNYALADEHNHEHILETGEPDLNNNGMEFDQNNHEHTHSHLHDFIYSDDHFHEHLTKEEIDATHNSPRYQQITFETYPVLTGKQTSLEGIDEALMYSGKPVVDVENRVFGYIGLNTKENSYKFYSVIESNQIIKKELLWTLKSDLFSNIDTQIDPLSSLEKLVGAYNRRSNFIYANKSIVLTAKDKLLYFTFEELFDDDEAEAREQRLLSPIFTSANDFGNTQSNFEYNSLRNTMVIVEDLKVWFVDFTEDSFSSPQFVKDFSLNNNSQNIPSAIKAEFFNGEIIVTKYFESNSNVMTSIISLQKRGLESNTIVPKTNNTIASTLVSFRTTIDSQETKNNKVIISINDSGNSTLDSIILDEISSVSSGFVSDTIYIPNALDFRTVSDITPYLQSDYMQLSPNSLRSPNLYLARDNTVENFGEVPDEVTQVKRAVIFDDIYGLVEIVDTDNVENLYFFTIGRTSYNLDNEFKYMKKLP